MNRGWLFNPKVIAGDTAVGFNDKTFKPVVLPHTNKLLPWHSFDTQQINLRITLAEPELV